MNYLLMTFKKEVFFDKNTYTFSYIIYCSDTKKSAIIDSVMDFDVKSGEFSTKSADNLINYINKNGLELEWILETHIHADHISAARYIKKKLGGRIAINEDVKQVAEYWCNFFGIECDISNFDHLFHDEEVFYIGNLEVKFLKTPGHTQSCSSFVILENIFVGDLIFMPDLGVGRADFPGGDAKMLFKSIQKIFLYPNHYKIFTAHDYPEYGEKEQFSTTILKHKQNNIFAKIIDLDEFVKKREDRDRELSEPKLIKFALKENIFSGKLI